MFKKIALSCLFVTLTSSKQVSEIEKASIKATISVQATNYTLVPSVTYIVNAVECLEEAYSIYDNDEERASLFAALFEEKYNRSWNVVVGYSAVYVHSSIYVETMVLGADDDDDDKKKVKDDDASKLFFLFSAD